MTCLKCQHCRSEKMPEDDPLYYCAFQFEVFPHAFNCEHYRLSPDTPVVDLENARNNSYCQTQLGEIS